MGQLVKGYFVEACSLSLSRSGQSLFIHLSDPSQGEVQLEVPGWIVQQLMRALPHLDAAMQAEGAAAPAGPMAYPVIQWQVQAAAEDDAVDLRFRNDRRVESALRLTPAEAGKLAEGLLAARAARSSDAACGHPAASPLHPPSRA